ncbi:MAG: glycosyltransferase family 4 protein, partial [Pirellulaceae bacterium]
PHRDFSEEGHRATFDFSVGDYRATFFEIVIALKIAYLTAGAAGMYCGSCLHDNALAKALIDLGHDALLIPLYTPILTDEPNVSSRRLFYGGLNVYLEQLSRLARWLPNWSDQFLSSPRLVGWIASRAMGTSASKLGALTVSMLKGNEGNQRKEVQRLCAWLKTLEPDVVIFSNLLIAGCIDELKSQVDSQIVVMLQGDDIFYDSLEEPYRQQAMDELRRLTQQVDLFIVHSRDYGERMQRLLGYADGAWQVNPLSIDSHDFVDLPRLEVARERPPTIGYLARLAPEKGLHLLVDAFIEIVRHPQMAEARLSVAGWLGKQHHPYWQQQLDKLATAGLTDRLNYHGSVDRAGKLQFLQSIDVLCVPTTYKEPKGLFVLEGLAAGVPYVQPAHGAFPEMHERIGGGYLFDPETPDALAERLIEVFSDMAALRELGQQGRQTLLTSDTTRHAAERLVAILKAEMR